MFHFSNTITYTDLFTFFLLLVAIIAAVFTYRQVRDNYRTQKAIFFKELYLTMFRDPDVSDAYHLIEYENFIYDNDHFQNSEKIEHNIDTLLVLFDLLSYLYIHNILI